MSLWIFTKASYVLKCFQENKNNSYLGIEKVTDRSCIH